MSIKFDKIRVLSTTATMAMLLLCLLVACNTENAPDCLQSAGDPVRTTVTLPSFNKITVFEGLNLVLKQGEQQQVVLASGKNLINDITAVVEGGRLQLRNQNGCNLFRDYGLSTVYVTHPNIVEVRSSTGGLISTEGTIDYPSLLLISESFNDPEAETTDGSFALDVNTNSLRIIVNGIAYFKLKGTTVDFNITVAAGDSRIEAQDLLANNVQINHRGTNDVLVYPQENISGLIRGYGDVVCFNRPAVVAVEEIFRGRLVFKD